MSPPKTGKLIILSGPSGAGKSTVLKQVLARFPGELRLSISATTRSPRQGEQDKIDYYFLTPEEFAARREAGEFLESCEVFGHGHWYGTLLSEVTPSLKAGTSVILEIDVDGTAEALKHYPDAMTIFLRPSSLEEVEKRLRLRGTESEAAIQRRLEVARREWELAKSYRYQVINDDVPAAVERMAEILCEAGLNDLRA